MPDAFKIEVQGLDALQKQLNGLPKKLTDGLDYALEKAARAIELKANQLKPTDLGGIQVRVDSKPLDKNITANANYAAFMEFGTGSYAAQYVSTLPQNWQEYAQQFKGSSDGGTFADLVRKIQEWANRQGIQDPQQAGYAIARSIIIKGVHPHPFLYPAFADVLPSLQADIQRVIDTFAV
jgi:hypothetical protein